MTEEIEDAGAEPEVVIEDQAPEPEVVIEDEAPTKKDDYVDLSPEAQRKFNDMYKQTKMSDQRNKFLLEANEAALKRIEELETRFKQTDQASAEQILMDKIIEARDNGDTTAEVKLLNELTDFKAEQKIRGAQKPKEKQPAPIENFGLEAQDVDYIKDTVFEQDDKGNYLRPWFHQGHPRYNTMLKHAAIISAEVEDEMGHIDTAEVMTRLEKAMSKTPSKPQSNSRAPDPMRSNLTNRPVRGTLKLSSAEAAIAAKLGLDPKVYAQSRDSLNKRG